MVTGPSRDRRRRATPEESRNEILDVAARVLWETPLSELTVGGLMARTRLGRSSFYVHFTDLGDLVVALLERLEQQLQDAASAWTDESARGPDALGTAIGGVVDVWTRHGPVLRAIVEAGVADPEVARLWREGVVERFAQTIAVGITEGSRATPPDVVDPHELATALLLMNERYLMDRLGRTPQADPDTVSATLRTIWHRCLYPDHDAGQRCDGDATRKAGRCGT